MKSQFVATNRRRRAARSNRASIFVLAFCSTVQIRHCCDDHNLGREVGGFRRVVLQLQHRQLATERRAEVGGGGGDARRKSANLFLCSLSWQLEAEKVGGWEKGDHYSEALFLITLCR